MLILLGICICYHVGFTLSHLKFSKRLWYYFSLLAYIVVLDLTLICKKWNDFSCNICAKKSQARENAEICLKII